MDDQGSAAGATGRYAEALLEALSDYLLTDEEVAALANLKEELGLSAARVRGIHAAVCQQLLSRFLDDRQIDADEANHLAFIWQSLRRLAWAPGDCIEPRGGEDDRDREGRADGPGDRRARA